MSEDRGELSHVKDILEQAKNHVKLECRKQIFEGTKKLTSEDLKTPQNPEEFTKRYIIEKVFYLLGVSYEAGERHFRTTDGIRKVDYEADSREFKFLVEAKAINDDLHRARYGAVEQVKGLFRLVEVKEKYSFGIATDGLRWVFINPLGEEVSSFSLLTDFSKIREVIIGRRDVRRERKQAEISKRFYQWYNALLHGGSYRDLGGRQGNIGEEDCLVRNVINVRGNEEREEIAQVIVDRLIFIKFLQAKEVIRENILEYLFSLPEDMLNEKMRQLFFSVLNTEAEKRIAVDPIFSSVPYLNGSLFTMTRAEERNPTYRIKAEILREVIKFLDTFRFASEGEAPEEGLNPEILGYIFERAMTATDRKGTGAYYTPKTITRYICENTIYPFILAGTREYLKDRKGYKDVDLPGSFERILELRSLTLRDVYADVIQKVTVLDPACGSGAFLLDAARVLFRIYRRAEDSLGAVGRNPDIVLKKIILRDSIYGVDINRKGVEIAKLRLWLWIAESYEPEGRIEALPNIEYNIRAGNSLLGYVDIEKFREAMVSMDDFLGLETPVMELIKERDGLLKEYKAASGERAQELKRKIEELDAKTKRRLDIHLFQDMKTRKIDINAEDFAKLDPFHWGFEFHKVFENGAGGFSIVIGNPPYVRQEALGDFKKILREYYEVYNSISDIYTYFYERSHKLLRPRGQFGFISSNKFMRSNYGKALRDFLINNYHIKQIVDFGELPVFEDAATFPAIFLTENLKPARMGAIYTPVSSLGFSSLDDVVKASGKKIPESAFQRFTWSLESEEANRILEKMDDIGVPLYDYTGVKSRFGVKTGFNKAFIIDKNTRNKLIKKDPKSTEIIKPIIVGDDVRRYEINFKDRNLIWTYNGVNIDRYPAIKKHLEQYQEKLEKRWDKGNYWWELRACDYYSDFDKPKIVYPDIGITPRFTLDTDNYFIEATAFEIPTDDTYLLSLLNSELLFFYIKSLTPILGDTRKRGRIRFKTVYLKCLPIRNISFSTPKDEREKLVEELKEYYNQGEFDKIFSAVETCIPKDEEGNFISEKEKSDVVHDFLAFLAEQMIEMNKEKNVEIKRFLAWLEGYTRVKVDEMMLKPKVKEYYKHDWGEMNRVLARNKTRMKFDPAEEKVKDEFEASTAKLKPLLVRIEGTDRLIDQVVYRLYGLTEEEIRVVEGAG